MPSSKSEPARAHHSRHKCGSAGLLEASGGFAPSRQVAAHATALVGVPHAACPQKPPPRVECWALACWLRKQSRHRAYRVHLPYESCGLVSQGSVCPSDDPLHTVCHLGQLCWCLEVPAAGRQLHRPDEAARHRQDTHGLNCGLQLHACHHAAFALTPAQHSTAQRTAQHDRRIEQAVAIAEAAPNRRAGKQLCEPTHPHHA